MKSLTKAPPVLLSLVVLFALVASACDDSSAPQPALALAAAPAPPSTPKPSPTPTLSAPPAAAGTSFNGPVRWVDLAVRRYHTTLVTARIGDVICGESDLYPEYDLTVASNEERPGCGRDGDVIRFFVGDERAMQTAVWHEGLSAQSLPLSISGPRAVFMGKVNRPYEEIVPYIGDNACGGTPVRGPAIMESEYWVVVLSDQQQPGCGTDGAAITFKLVDKDGNPVAAAAEQAVWHQQNVPDFDLTFPFDN